MSCMMCDVCRDGECLPRVGLCKAELIWCTCSKAGCKSPQLRRVKKLLLLAWPCLRGEAGVWWSTAAVLWYCWWCSSLLEDALVHAGSENTRQPVTLAKALAQYWCLGQHSGQSRISARALSISRWRGRCSPIPSGGEWAALKTVSLLFNEMLQWCIW